MCVVAGKTRLDEMRTGLGFGLMAISERSWIMHKRTAHETLLRDDGHIPGKLEILD